MSALTVKDCIGNLKYVLTALLPIATYTDVHVMLDKIIILKDYVNLINNTVVRVCFFYLALLQNSAVVMS